MIGNLLYDPQAMAVLARQRIQASPVRGSVRLGDPEAIVASLLPGGCQQVTVVNLAMQGTG